MSDAPPPETAPPETAPSEAALAALRAEIDAADDALHALLMRRAEVVQRLASSAAKPQGTVLRPGREARILRRLLAGHQGAMPRATLVQVWREIFAGSIAQQASFSVSLPADPALARLAASHFGAATPLRQHPSAGAALSALGQREAAVAVLPWPRESDNEAESWWMRLDAQHLSIIARLPFLSEREPPLEAAVVALYPADPSGEDARLVRVELPGTPDRASVAAMFPGGRVVVLRREGTHTLALIETDGTVPADAAVLGRYAIPERGAPST
ncbi:chorismate mutase [Roseococcus suduntuyensis]|uniref:chorismate mutase n=1 Tax=Roseococcus suduntuyensis TaxID=455361 RepID=A0A840A6U8_9PROT|nr:chorismate mutase [Roseococcus suduntuyensis]MBB3896582.1 chorismate mutase [Roseococcus suduntuyensis]